MKKFLQKVLKLKITPIFLFGVFFGLLEAIVVIYLRLLFNSGETLMNSQLSTNDIAITLGFLAFLKPQASIIITQSQRILSLELWRELSTIIILITVALLAGKTIKEKVAYFLLAFGVWDIFYYIFLRLLVGWPKSLFDMDVLFLIPVAWISPVILPILISVTMIILAIFLLKKTEK